MAEKEKKSAEIETKEAKQAKPEKPKKEKKGKVKDWWKGFKSDVKKIVWPNWKQVLKNTLVVLVVVGSCAVVIAALDITFHEGIKALPELIKKIKG